METPVLFLRFLGIFYTKHSSHDITKKEYKKDGIKEREIEKVYIISKQIASFLLSHFLSALLCSCREYKNVFDGKKLWIGWR